MLGNIADDQNKREMLLQSNKLQCTNDGDETKVIRVSSLFLFVCAEKFLLTLYSRCRLISSSCLQVCCGNRYKKASIRSLSEAQLREFQNFTLESSCERSNTSNAYIIAKINDKLTDKTICAGVLVHRKFLLTTAVCVVKWVKWKLVLSVN